MLHGGIQQSHIYTAAETSGTALGRKELLWKLSLHKLPIAELSGQNMTGFCQEKEKSELLAEPGGSAPRADPPTDQENISRMEGFLFP